MQAWVPHQECRVPFWPPPYSVGNMQIAAGGPPIKITTKQTWLRVVVGISDLNSVSPYIGRSQSLRAFGETVVSF